MPRPSSSLPRQQNAATVRDAKLGQLERERERPDILITKPEDVAFVGRLVAAVTQWLEVGGGGAGLGGTRVVQGRWEVATWPGMS